MSSLEKPRLVNYLTIVLFAALAGLGVIVLLQHNKINLLTFLENRWKSNFASQLVENKLLKNKYEKLVVSSVTQSLDYEDQIFSKEEEIERLSKLAGNLGLEVKDLRYLLSIKADTIVDTIIKTRIVSVPEAAEVRYHDTLYLGTSAVYRVMDPKDSTSRYIAELGGSLNVYMEPEQKQGKWRIRNLFVARSTKPVISVDCDNPLISFKNMKMVVVDKREPRKTKKPMKPITSSMASF